MMLEAYKMEMKNVKGKIVNLRGTISFVLFADGVISFTNISGSVEDLKCGISNGFCCFPIFRVGVLTKLSQSEPGLSS